MINVAVVEYNEIIREGLKVLINGAEGFTCKAVFIHYDEFIKASKKFNPDVLLIDISPEKTPGIESIKKIKKLLPDLPVLVLTLYEDNSYLFDAICAGACGYIPKNTSTKRLIKTIEEAYKGGTPMSSRIARKTKKYLYQSNINLQDLDLLSETESEILDKMIEGNSFKAIAESLYKDVEDVRFSLKSIYQKLYLKALQKP